LGAIASAIKHIQDFLQSDFSELLRFSQQLEGDRRETMFALIKIALNQPQSRSTRELRQIRKQISETLGAHQIENANAIASLLVGIGLDQNLEPFLELLPQLNQQNVLAKVYQVANLRTSAQTIAIATERSAKVAFALKSYSHYQNNDQKTLIQITDNIETVLTLYQTQLNQGVTILRKYDPSISTIFCYGDELTQVWTNIIHNAIQAMSNQGILEIETQLIENQVLVKISDSGSGIPPEIQAKIFQPFFTTKPAGEGSGLGLDIVKRIIEKHEGTITVESIPGKTTFSIILPIGAIAEI
jgi:two-component system, NtrC family, sensor kinase